METDGLKSSGCGPTVFYSKPWTVELHLALEEHWNGRHGPCEHLTQHLEVAEGLRARGRVVHFLTEEVASLEIPVPRTVLGELEKRFGAAVRPLNRYMLAERYFEGRDPQWQVDQTARYALWLDAYFGRQKPRAVIGNAPDEMAIWLAFDIARFHGSEIVALLPSVVPPGRLYVMDDYARIPGAEDRYLRLRETGVSPVERKLAQAVQANVSSGKNLSYVAERTKLDRVRHLVGGQFVRNQVLHTRTQVREKRAGNWYLQPATHRWIAERLLSVVRGRLVDKRFLTGGMPSDPYLFFPLHFQPESSTLIAGSHFVNQIEVIKSLARALPVHWDLAVKEHFWMRGQRETAYYRELAAIPNVRLIGFDVPTKDLIDHAEVTAVVTGTSGLEAALMGRGVLVFGEVPWQHAPTVECVGSLLDLPGSIERASRLSREVDRDDVLAFAVSWDMSLPEGRYFEDVVVGWNDPENIANLARAVEGRMAN